MTRRLLRISTKSQQFDSRKRSTHQQETGSSDQFGVVREVNKTMTNFEVQPGKDRNTGPNNQPTEPEVDYEETSIQRRKTRVSLALKCLEPIG